MDYGVNLNASYVMNGDDIELGIHATDSEGLDVSTKVSGDSMEDIFDTAISELVSGIQEHKNEKQEDAADDVTRLKEQNARLQERVEQLQKELNVKNSAKTATSAKSSKDVFEKNPVKDIDPGIYERAKDKADDMMDDIDEILRKLFAANGEDLPKKKDKPARKQSWNNVKYQMKDSDRYPRTLWF